MTRAITIGSLACTLILTGAPALGQGNIDPGQGPPASTEPVATGPSTKLAGKATVVEVRGKGGVPVREERFDVTRPGEVGYEFTARGGTLRGAKMLHERYTRDEELALIAGLPEDKRATGPIDLVTTWDPAFLPYRIAFRELTYQGQIRRVRRRTTKGQIVDGRIEAPKVEDLTVDRALRHGDKITITAPEAVKGEYTVAKVHESGALSVEPGLAKGTFEGVAYEAWIKGDFKELFDAEPTFVRVADDASPNVPAQLPVRYIWPDPNTDTSDVFIEKRWEVGAQPYEMTLTVVVHNVGSLDLKEGFGLKISGWQHPTDTGGSMFRQPTNVLAASCFTDDSLERYLFPQLLEEQQEDYGGKPITFENKTHWVGLDTTYFLSAAVPRSIPDAQCQIEAYKNGVIQATLWSSSVLTLHGPERVCTPGWMPKRDGVDSCPELAALIGAAPNAPKNKIKAAWIKAKAAAEPATLVKMNKAWEALRSRQQHIYRFTVYIGPKDVQILKDFDTEVEASNRTNLVEAMDYGMLGFIAEVMHGLMKWFHTWAGHWGLAIILLTILVKGLLLPLTNKSFQNMQMMKKLQPEMTAIKEKHKGDQQKVNADMMALYKRHGFNPLMGCFPMLLQMPIWIALYQTIGSAVELYHAPLGLWIQDLSAGDPLYIMPIALGILMLAQSHLTTSTGGDGLQQKLLKYGMPMMFSVFMLFLPSGLVLYILVNTTLTIIQNLVIRKRMGITS